MHERSTEASDFKMIEVRENEQAYIKQLRELSITDSLTKLYNRHYFNEFMPKLLALAKRKGYFITFFILDVDNFKPYNDNYGHIAGDKALLSVAERVKHHIQRNDDFVFRFGGEEFGGVMLTDDPKRSIEHVQELCPLVESLNIEHHFSATSDKLTISVGIVSIDPHIELSIEEIYLLADRELYKVKKGSKNGCSVKMVSTPKDAKTVLS
jgi:diguanylate cyclase (GGDEF)-like protein